MRLEQPSPEYDDPQNKRSPLRARGFLDTHIAGRRRSRRIKNDTHFQRNGLWSPSNVTGSDLPGTPGQWPLPGITPQWGVIDGPQEFYATNTPSQSPQGATTLVRRSERPDLWVAATVINSNNGKSPTRNGNVFTWPNLLPGNGTMVLTALPASYKKVISYPGMPTENPVLAFATGDDQTIEVSADKRSLHFLTHETGSPVEYMRTNPAVGGWGETDPDALIDDPSLGGVGGIELIDLGTVAILGRTYHKFELRPIAAEWASQFGPVWFDPSVTISGTGNIEDTFISNTFPTIAPGGLTTVSIGANYKANLWRFTGLPDASAVTRCDHFVYVTTTGLSFTRATPHAILDANESWEAGTGGYGAPPANASTWNDKNNGGATWAGGSATGCLGASNHDVATLGPLVDMRFLGWKTFNYDNATVLAWILGTRLNAGVVWDATVSTRDNSCVSTEGASNQPYVEIDYEAAVTAGRRHSIGGGIGRGIGRGMR